MKNLLRVIKEWFRRNFLAVPTEGIDLLPEAWKNIFPGDQGENMWFGNKIRRAKHDQGGKGDE